MTKVKLAADCHVGGELKKQGETVELPEEIAKDFGEVVTEPKQLPPAQNPAAKPDDK